MSASVNPSSRPGHGGDSLGPRWLVRLATARWTFLGLSGALAAILVFSTVSTWGTARAAFDTMVAGQAGQLIQTVRDSIPMHPPERTAAALEAFVAQQHSSGLRYVALVDDHVRLHAEAGASVLGEPPIPPPPGAIVSHGSTLRLSAPAGPPPHSPPPGAHHGPGHPRPNRMIVLEFEPALGATLQAQAQRSLAIGIAGGIGLLVVAGLSFALSRRAAAIENHLAERRHLASLGEMSAVLAHELRNPLTSLRGHAQLLVELLAQENIATAQTRARDKAERVVAETTRLRTLIDGLLEFAKSGAIQRTPTDPVALVRAAVTDVDVARIDLDDAGAPTSWSLDGPRVQQVVTNLLANAVQASPADARVVVTITQSGTELVIAVRDRGEGVPEALRHTLFEPFHSGRTRGVGLGLAVARHIVDLHGGTLGFTDGVPTGSVFTAKFPAHGVGA